MINVITTIPQKHYGSALTIEEADRLADSIETDEHYTGPTLDVVWCEADHMYYLLDTPCLTSL